VPWLEETDLTGSRGYAAHEVMSPEFSRTDENIHCATSRRHRETAEQQLTAWVGGRARKARRARRGSPNQGLRTCPGSTETRAEYAQAPGLVEPRAEDVPEEHGSRAQNSARLPGPVEPRAGDVPG
jgi:hypothetical protein